ncbi:MAG TPA: hypothetical protein VHI52_07835 [Verrucomicrobiae bacterium]|nr:hypothetical protein [Verrucomicrobiae bacterium]
MRPLLLLSTLMALAGTIRPSGAEPHPIAPPPFAATQPALTYENPKHLTAEIYSQDGDRRELLFRFERQASREGKNLIVLREYKYPDGKLAARERFVYQGDALKLFALEELQTGGQGSAAIKRVAPGHDTIDFTYFPEPGIKPKLDSEPLRPETLVNDMVGQFLVSHWDQLARGEKVRCRYMVVPRRETVGFTFIKTAESSLNGQPVVTVKMEPTSALLAALVKPLLFTLEKNHPHRVLQYVGRTTPKLKVGSKWTDLDALTVFDWADTRP